MLNVLKRIFIGVTVGLLIFLIKDNVFALETSNFLIFDSNKYGDLALHNVPTPNRPRIDLTFDHPFTNSSNYDYMVFSFAATLNSQGSYNVNIDPSLYSTYDGDILNYMAFLIDSTGSYTFCSSSGVNLFCPMNPGKTYTSISISFSHDNYSSSTAYISYYLTWMVMLIDSDTSNAVQEQTDDLENLDSPADNSYNNDYSTNSYDQAESQINSNLNVDVSGFVFDPTRWQLTFAYIWNLTTSFVQLNAKVFAAITGFLTFSFVGLVIGRS